MDELYPLRFEPIFKNYLWGGRRLVEWFPTAPAEGPVAEAWLVSDEAGNPSVVADGPLTGATLRDLIDRFGERLLGRPATSRVPLRPASGATGWRRWLLGRPATSRFPILLKFLDARAALSVQVHPTDEQAAKTRPDARGKTEAWVVLRSEPGDHIYAGLKDLPGGVAPFPRWPGDLYAGGVKPTRATAEWVRQALADHSLVQVLHAFEPRPGDCVFLPAGTVHAVGAGLMIFEVQQTSDITYRLYDWNRVDPKTGQGRPLHVEESLACINFEFGPCDPVRPVAETATCERLVDCRYFRLWRHRSDAPFTVGAPAECRIAVAVGGSAQLDWAGATYRLATGDVLFLPASVGACRVVPDGAATVLECGLPI